MAADVLATYSAYFGIVRGGQSADCISPVGDEGVACHEGGSVTQQVGNRARHFLWLAEPAEGDSAQKFCGPLWALESAGREFRPDKGRGYGIDPDAVLGPLQCGKFREVDRRRLA